MTSARTTIPIRPARPVNAPPAPHVAGAPWPVDELAQFLSVSTQMVHKLAKAGRLRRIEGLGRRTLIADESVRKLLASEAAPQSASPSAAG